MKLRDLQSMSVDELWSLHQSILRVLPQKLASEKSRLEQRLRQLRSPSEKPREKGARRPIRLSILSSGTRANLKKPGQDAESSRVG